jgi:alpha,alpha-trehalose phosphorylase
MKLSFSLLVRGHLLGVQITHDGTTYTLRRGEVLHLRHDGEAVQVKAGSPVTLPTTSPPAQERCAQPPGREPARRQPQAGLAAGKLGQQDHLAAE